MWNSKKSVTLTLIVTRILAVAFFILLFAAPFLFNWYVYTAYAYGSHSVYVTLVATFYGCSPSAAVALWCINDILVNVRKGEVFTEHSVKMLRILSWACFSAVPLSLPMCYSIFEAFPIPFAAFFTGLLMRVVKNVIEEGTAIKNENDLTV